MLENTDSRAWTAPLQYGPPEHYYELDLSPPEGLTISLWRSLLSNVLDRVSPERLPPLELTSEPVDTGILFGDLIELPWYRTVFSNLGDVVSPELQAPLQLTSRPVDVGELPGDMLSHPWWHSLAATWRDKLSPERLPALRLTSHPVAGFGNERELQVLDWSSLIEGPKVFLPDAPREMAQAWQAAPQPMPEPVRAAKADAVLIATKMQFMRDLARSRFRKRIWISLAAAEALFLIGAIIRYGSNL